jgi:hypothetical protein
VVHGSHCPSILLKRVGVTQSLTMAFLSMAVNCS